MYDRIKQHGHICVVFGGYGQRSQCIRCRALSPYRNTQSTSYRKHMQVPCLNKSSREHREYGAYRESAGCEVHHASAGGDKLIVMTTLGVADCDGASVLVACDKTFS